MGGLYPQLDVDRKEKLGKVEMVLLYTKCPTGGFLFGGLTSSDDSFYACFSAKAPSLPASQGAPYTSSPPSRSSNRHSAPGSKRHCSAGEWAFGQEEPAARESKHQPNTIEM